MVMKHPASQFAATLAHNLSDALIENTALTERIMALEEELRKAKDRVGKKGKTQ